MPIFIETVMREVRNYFPAERIEGAFTIADGWLSPDALLLPGDYVAFRYDTPVHGVYRCGAGGRIEGISDASFTGTMWRLSPPADFEALSARIEDYVQTHAPSPIAREQLGDYSCTLRPDGWQTVFAADLIPYRRMYAGVKVD